MYRIHFLSASTTHFLVSTHCALQGSRLKTQAPDKVVSASFIVIPRAHSHPVSLMSLLNVTFAPFPSLPSSSCAPSSTTSTPLPSRTKKSGCQTPNAPTCRWRESGHLTDSAPITTKMSGSVSKDGCNWTVGNVVGENWLRNGIQWCFISVVRGQRRLQLPIEFVCL